MTADTRPTCYICHVTITRRNMGGTVGFSFATFPLCTSCAPAPVEAEAREGHKNIVGMVRALTDL